MCVLSVAVESLSFTPTWCLGLTPPPPPPHSCSYRVTFPDAGSQAFVDAGAVSVVVAFASSCVPSVDVEAAQVLVNVSCYGESARGARCCSPFIGNLQAGWSPMVILHLLLCVCLCWVLPPLPASPP